MPTQDLKSRSKCCVFSFEKQNKKLLDITFVHLKHLIVVNYPQI